MSEHVIHLYAVSAVQQTNASSGAPLQGNPIRDALNGDAFSWENPNDVALVMPSETVAIHFDDADGQLTDDPVAGAEVLDQRLTRPVSINGTDYTPNDTALRWENPPPVYLENEYEVVLYDAAGVAYRMVGVSITEGYTTTVVGVMFEGAQPPAGTVLYYRQGVSTYEGTGQSTPVSPAMPCFVAGTLIDTPDGPRRIEDLAPGDLVATLDAGPQPVRWIGRGRVCGLGPLAPIRIAAGALGNRRDLLVSPNHRILLRTPWAELLFAEPEVLVPAKALVDGCRIRPAPMPQVEYLHLLLDGHHIVYSEGIPSESLFTGAQSLATLGPEARAELTAIFPDLPDMAGQLRRPSLSPRQTRVLLEFSPAA